MTDDAWAILAEPPGRRDLACPVFCERSLARSRRRRELAAARRGALPRTATGRVSAALLAATLAGPAAQLASAVSGATAVAANLHRGSRGSGVAAVQRALGIPADGIFGPQTRRAVRAFQAAHGLLVDGIVGPQTSAALGLGASRPGSGRIIRMPVATAMAVQRALGVPADGIFGPISRAALRSFQRAHGLLVDGIPGPQSLAALGLSGSLRTTSGVGGGVPAAVAAARSKLGSAFALGGTGPTAFDCSGLVQWAMRQAGVTLPRTSFAQFGVGSPVPSSQIRSGDLVFFNTDGPGASHVGIATAANSVISATNHGVREHTIFGPYWGRHYVGARRVG
jgi:cell wall-associated NlpC family hydrolase